MSFQNDSCNTTQCSDGNNKMRTRSNSIDVEYIIGENRNLDELKNDPNFTIPYENDDANEVSNLNNINKQDQSIGK